MKYGYLQVPYNNAATTVANMALAEGVGFTNGWIPDSHIIWSECFQYLTLCAQATESMMLGTMVTSPVTRHETVVASSISTLDEISGGRAVLGIGRGDSSVRTLGMKPIRVDDFKQSTDRMITLSRGGEVECNGVAVQIPWRAGREDSVPLYVAAYGPRVLEYAGMVADGVILQIASPVVIKWCIEQLKKGVDKAGRSLQEIDIVAAAACCVGDDEEYCLNLARPFPAAVSNHIKSVLKTISRDEMPEELARVADVIKDYDYHSHGKMGASHAAAVPDEMVRDYTIIGTAAECRDKVAQLKEAGVTQVAIYNMTEELGQPDHVTRGNIEAFGEAIIPHIA
ncbi:MAG: LLM class flavin-dependent oxidoreductase [Rhodospirillales bacterium]|jgi:alkanesulfonate monooxygenase SsuD/methylene tetrahydromethanopterin reductase-like flavin-dependent oxidoreductase (luciferase family)|nr:LLM class flavin-dependent oxidoreductase [Rhodospirillales bacterium]